MEVNRKIKIIKKSVNDDDKLGKLMGQLYLNGMQEKPIWWMQAWNMD